MCGCSFGVTQRGPLVTPTSPWIGSPSPVRWLSCLKQPLAWSKIITQSWSKLSITSFQQFNLEGDCNPRCTCGRKIVGQSNCSSQSKCASPKDVSTTSNDLMKRVRLIKSRPMMTQASNSDSQATAEVEFYSSPAPQELAAGEGGPNITTPAVGSEGELTGIPTEPQACRIRRILHGLRLWFGRTSEKGWPTLLPAIGDTNLRGRWSTKWSGVPVDDRHYASLVQPQKFLESGTWAKKGEVYVVHVTHSLARCGNHLTEVECRSHSYIGRYGPGGNCVEMFILLICWVTVKRPLVRVHALKKQNSYRIRRSTVL